MHARPLIVVCLLALGACSPARLVTNVAASAITGGGDVYASDDDPELVMAALPFGLKTMEGLLQSAPDNRRLQLAAARGFAGYAYLVQELEASAAEPGSEERRAIERRVARLFLRARDHALAGLEARHAGFGDALKADPGAALAVTDREDVELLYWAGAAWLGAISADRRDLGRLAEMPAAAALVERVLALDEGFDGGAAHEVLVAYEAGRSGGSLASAEQHYRRALELAGGASATAHVAYAESVAVARQDRAAFRHALEAALAVDPDAVPSRRLVTELAHRKARRLLASEPLLFVAAERARSWS